LRKWVVIPKSKNNVKKAWNVRINLGGGIVWKWQN